MLLKGYKARFDSFPSLNQSSNKSSAPLLNTTKSRYHKPKSPNQHTKTLTQNVSHTCFIENHFSPLHIHAIQPYSRKPAIPGLQANTRKISTPLPQHALRQRHHRRHSRSKLPKHAQRREPGPRRRLGQARRHDDRYRWMARQGPPPLGRNKQLELHESSTGHL